MFGKPSARQVREAKQIRAFKAGKPVPAKIARKAAEKAQREADFRSAKAQARARARKAAKR